MSKKFIVACSLSALALVATVPALAATNNAQHQRFGQPAISGPVTAVNGNTITLTGANGTVYTIDATSAKIRKSGATIQVSGIAVGDTLAVRGTVSGTNVAAASIMDGQGAAGSKNWSATANMSLGTITAISGSNFTMDSHSKTGTSTVNVATTASTVFKNNQTVSALSNLAVGQRVVVAGTKDSSNNIASATSVTVITGNRRDGQQLGNFKPGANIQHATSSKGVLGKKAPAKAPIKSLVKKVVKKVVKTVRHTVKRVAGQK